MNNALMLSILYKGVHYDAISPYKQDIIKNHKAFSKYNGMDYKLYGEEITNRYDLGTKTFTEYDIPYDILQLFPGIGKLYSILAAQEDYPEKTYYMFVDFDSVFMDNIQLNDGTNTEVPGQDFGSHKLITSCRQLPYLYDTSFLYYYCMYTGMTFEDIKHLRYRYNSGLFIVTKDVITRELVDNYVDFCIDIHQKKIHYSTYGDDKTIHETHAMTLPYKEVSNSDREHLLFHPSDEVFFQWLQIKLKSDGDYIPELTDKWNKLNNSDDAYHVHCIDKALLPEMLKKSIVNV